MNPLCCTAPPVLTIALVSALASCTGDTVAPNQAPTVTISIPSADTAATAPQSVPFLASANDPEDGDLTVLISWRSDLEGVLGSGGALSAPLGVGTHTVSATVTDADGVSDTAFVTVDVTFREDFSSFADGVVPVSPGSGYEYKQNDSLTDVAVQVVAASGDLTDRPIVLRKSDSESPGAPNFSISRRGLDPLAGVASGLIDFGIDVQVNGEGFCQFLVLRDNAGTPVSVSLHDLPYTVGVPFRVVMTVDVDAGTISATQDGDPVSTSTTSSPGRPVRFGLEGCTTLAQESAYDNIIIGIR